MGYFIHWTPDEDVLRANEHFACRNASVIVDENDNFCGWIDNTQLTPYYVEERNIQKETNND